ncbi:MAG: 50S ribosomal protein L23 [Calditrichae bacterium]|nr:50S ribosomal protein L23 [Calditrichota bacterium]MCB9059799.1 50S ribosomal protein L23 [Calditrichia bacterium]
MKTRITLVRPLYTEKMAGQQEALNKYAFQVDRDANKIEIKKAIETKFEVKVKSVRTMNLSGKMRQQMTRQGRFSGRRPNWKKAIITLEPDYKLELFDNA